MAGKIYLREDKMPNYEYECVDCGKKIEIMHNIEKCYDNFTCGCGGKLKRNITFNGAIRVDGGTPKFYSK